MHSNKLTFIIVGTIFLTIFMVCGLGIVAFTEGMRAMRILNLICLIFEIVLISFIVRLQKDSKTKVKSSCFINSMLILNVIFLVVSVIIIIRSFSSYG